MKNSRKHISTKDLTVIAGKQGVKFNTMLQSIDWAKAHGYKLVDLHNRLDDCNRQIGVKL